MSKAIKPLTVAIQANIPVIVIGEPGTGKTAIIEQTIAPSLNMRHETVIASIRDVTDFSGLPIVTENGVTLAPPPFARRIKESDQPTLLFFDEISTAPPACQAGVLRIINERWVGDCKLPDSCRIVAAMNPAFTSAGGGELTAPLANRFCHVTWSVDNNSWIDWSIGRSQAHAMIAGFIKSKGQALLQVPKNENDLGRPWPSPRTWDMAGRLMTTNKENGNDPSCETQLVVGCIGEGMGAEFLNWRNALDLPDPEELLAKPNAFKVPERGDRTFTILASVSQAVVSNMTKERYLAAWTIFNKATQGGHKDIAAASVVTLVRAAMGQKFMADTKLRDQMRELIVPFTVLLTQAGLVKEV